MRKNKGQQHLLLVRRGKGETKEKKRERERLRGNACTAILVGMASPVLEICYFSNLAKYPFPTMDYSPWSSKNLIDRNRLKKFMQSKD